MDRYRKVSSEECDREEYVKSERANNEISIRPSGSIHHYVDYIIRLSQV
jgi:hypothetical protein